jgi:hypothetical protein
VNVARSHDGERAARHEERVSPAVEIGSSGQR